MMLDYQIPYSSKIRQKLPWILSISLIIIIISGFLVARNTLTQSPTPDGPERAANIDGIWYYFHPNDVTTLRWDLFQPGHFSLFDILVHLEKERKIQLVYHFNETMDTHVIDSLNGHPYWWYEAQYERGWREDNAHRMDYYPWKNETKLFLIRTTQSFIQTIYSAFVEQFKRRVENQNQIIIPRIYIEAPSGHLEFENISVRSHNLRNDFLRTGVITAMDVILSLGDQDLITYELQWIESIGRVEHVRSYWVQAINDDLSQGRCGWVYETGSLETVGQNHIHIPSDIRILYSPYYVSWFWICL